MGLLPDAQSPDDWKWSSAGARMDEKDDILVKTRPLLEIANTPWGYFLSSDIKKSELDLFRKHERTRRPLGKTTFVKQLETILDRRLRPKKPGRKKNR